MMRKVRMHVARMAKKPRTTITAIAQWGKEASFDADWTPCWVACAALDRDADAADSEADDKDAAADVEAIDAITESA